VSLDHERVISSTAGVAPSADGTAISFETTAPRDRALVFVHGWSCDRMYWRHQVAAFADEYRVVTIDLAGHGASGAGRKSWTMPAFGEDVIDVVGALELRDIVLIGHSMGGDVIVEAALALGDRVAGIVWVDTYSRLAAPDTPEQVDASLEPFQADFTAATRSFVRQMFPATAKSDLVEEIVADMSSAPPVIALDALRHSWANEETVMAALPRLEPRRRDQRRLRTDGRGVTRQLRGRDDDCDRCRSFLDARGRRRVQSTPRRCPGDADPTQPTIELRRSG
jgi:pimeloyl-ACP methyl ester carboxylesterase